MRRSVASILVVDDEPDICQNLADIFQDLGYEVDTAPSGREALLKVEQRHYDVALLDFKMPGMDGLTLYDRIRVIQSDIVAIIISAYASPETTEKALTAGAWHVLSKPLDLRMLLPLVMQAANQPMVMIVDDDVALCESLWDLFRLEGYRVLITHDEESAIKYLQSDKYDVVLVDLKLPEGSGINVLQAIKQIAPNSATILITGNYADLEAQNSELPDVGVTAICEKPFDIPKMLSLMKSLTSGGDGSIKAK